MGAPDAGGPQPHPGAVDPPRFVASPLKLSVVVPMFNEAENVEKTVARLGEALLGFTDGPWEVIVVNDGSSDDTWAIARALAARPEFPWLRVGGYQRNRGRGFALRTGFAMARGEWIVSIDADLSYDPAYILDLVGVLREEEDIDLVLASAYMPGGGVEGVPIRRLWVSRLGNKMLSWFMSSSGRKVNTITCVFRAYRRYVLDNLELESDGKDIHLEILSKALMLGYRFKEIPAVLRWRKHGASKHVFSHTAFTHLVFALFERPILVFGMIGLMLMTASIAGIAYILSIWLQHKLDPLHNQPLNPERPLMTLVVLTFLGGLQLISFGVMGALFVNLRKEVIKIQARLRQLSERHARHAADVARPVAVPGEPDPRNDK
ncbi:MAG: glycosyltransferase [bacterium]|nr:glycosyltransferase [bacterium]